MVWICTWDLTRRITETEHHYKWGQICFKKKSEGESNKGEEETWEFTGEFTGERAIHWWGGGALIINRQTGWWLTAWPQVRRRSVINEPAEVCLFVFRSIYSAETKTGQTFRTWLILQHFLVHLCDFEAFTGGQAEPSQRDESVICQDRTHESESGVNAAATHVWKTTYNRGTHSEQVKATTQLTTNLQLHHRTAEADVSSSHTNQNSFDFILLIQCLTSGPKTPHRDEFISLD